MKVLLYIFTITALALVGCISSTREVRVKDVTKSETIILKKRFTQDSISGLRVVGSGSIDGKAEVHLMLNGAVSKKEEVSGSVSFEWDGDWYADQAEVRYVPGTATSGTVTLKYQFR
jgi:hypothetical protein